MVGYTKILFLILMLAIILSSSYVTVFYEQEIAAKITQTASVFLIAAILDILASRLIVRNIKDMKVRFIIAKTAGYVTYMIALIIALAVWVEQASNLLFALGVVGAGVAIALQRPITNIVGFIVLMIFKPYAPGDRIEIGGEKGDVIDIKLFYTKIMETGEWTMYDQFTGRIKSIPNYYVLEKVVNNYSADFGFIWEEIMIPVTYSSDWKKARKIMLDIANKETKEIIRKGERQLKKMTYRYLVEPRAVEPAVYIIPTDNWLELRLRFIVDAKHRRSSVNPVYEDIVNEFNKQRDIRISSKTTARVWDAPRKANY